MNSALSLSPEVSLYWYYVAEFVLITFHLELETRKHKLDYNRNCDGSVLLMFCDVPSSMSWATCSSFSCSSD